MELIHSSPTPAAVGAFRRRHGHFLLGFFQYLWKQGRVYCLDAGNCFNPHPLAKMARSRGIPPEQILENLLVSRAATCHQIVSGVEEMLLPLSQVSGEKIALVLAIDSLFMDEDIPLFERRHLFERILRGVIETSRSMGCLVTYTLDPDRQNPALPWRQMLAARLRMPTPPMGPGVGGRGILHPSGPGRLQEEPHGKNPSDLYELS